MIRVNKKPVERLFIGKDEYCKNSAVDVRKTKLYGVPRCPCCGGFLVPDGRCFFCPRCGFSGCGV
ncbi:MAG: hypothetical protein N2316_12315 [Spirochaetes bacterium]|nr:hypothetical protein [Spirochaetota bacterium]